jgi:putative ABC transport system permease protein
MKFLPFILRNTFRNRRRTILTILSIGMSLFLITTLRTLLVSLESPPLTPESAKRVVTRHQTSLANVMPVAHKQRIRQIPGVEEVISAQWFGGVYKDPANFFAQFAMDADGFFNVFPEISVEAPGQKEAFVEERTAALAGVSLARRYGWKVGDRITLQGSIFPVNPELIIRGIVQGGGSDNTFYFHWDYFNELLDDANISGTFFVKARSADDIPAISEAVDSMFANSTAPTKTETEKAFVLGFVSMIGNVRTLVVSISTVVVFTIILVAANTMAMSIRERTGEIAILKTLGFSQGQVLSLMITESAAIALAGGLAGSLAARYVFGAVDFNELTFGFIQAFNVTWDTILLSAAISLFVAITSTLVPAWSASRLAIADAIRRRGE